jgi:lysophospholipase L1-like esterase
MNLRMPPLQIGLLAVLLAAAGCGRAPAVRPVPPNAVVLAFGDSLTAGTGADAGEAYPDALQQLLRRPVINAGQPGELSGAGLARLPRLLDEHHPALVILCHGGNDLLRQMPRAETMRHLEAMLRLLHERDIDVILLGVPAPGLLARPPDFYRDLARRHRVPYDGKTLPRILSDRTLKSDPIHPNAAGYRQLAEAVARLVPPP